MFQFNFASIPDIPIKNKSSTVELKILTITTAIKRYSQITTKKKKKKHDEILFCGKS